MTFSGIVFDFNGTLFLDSDKQEKAWRIVSRELRGQDFGKEEMRRHMHGRPSRVIFEYLTGRPLADEEVWRLSARKEEIYRDLCVKDRSRFHLTPGAPELLDRLCRAGIPHTIATASEIVNVTFFFERFELGRWFDRKKVVYDDGTFPGKPFPDIYRKAAANLSLSPSACIVAEDAPSGIEAARRAGAGYIVAVDSGATDPQRIRTLPGVNAVIDDFGSFDDSLLGL